MSKRASPDSPADKNADHGRPGTGAYFLIFILPSALICGPVSRAKPLDLSHPSAGVQAMNSSKRTERLILHDAYAEGVENTNFPCSSTSTIAEGYLAKTLSGICCAILQSSSSHCTNRARSTRSSSIKPTPRYGVSSSSFVVCTIHIMTGINCSPTLALCRWVRSAIIAGNGAGPGFFRKTGMHPRLRKGVLFLDTR
jgi:hypothetical protein